MKVIRRVVTKQEVEACQRCEKWPAEWKWITSREPIAPRLGEKAGTTGPTHHLLCDLCLTIATAALAKRVRKPKAATT